MSQRLILNHVFEDSKLFSLLFLKKHSELTGPQLSLDYKELQHLVTAIEINNSLFDSFQTSFPKLLNQFYQNPAATTLFL